MKLGLHEGVFLRRFGDIHSYDQSHVFAGEDRIWEELLRVPLDLIEKGVIMVGIVVGQDQPLDSGALRAFDPLQVARVTPTAMVGQFLRCVLSVMEKKVGASTEVNDVRIDVGSMFDVTTEDDRLAIP